MSNKQSFKKSTAHKYEYLIEKHILPTLGASMLRSINIIMLNKFAENKLECGSLDGNKALSKSYVRSMMLIIDSVLRFAAEKGWCKPLAPIYKPSQKRKS